MYNYEWCECAHAGHTAGEHAEVEGDHYWSHQSKVSQLYMYKQTFNHYSHVLHESLVSHCCSSLC